jgi:membrane protein DedA with SNARE-associated domain
MMNEAVQFLIEQGYIVFFLWVLFEKLGFPIPIVPVLIGAGALAGIGKLNFSFVFCLAFIAALLSDQFWYQVGLRRGSKVLSFLCRISLDPDSCVRRTKGIFSRYGAQSLLFAKFIPGMANIAPPLAGIFHMRLLRFLFFDGLGAFIWVGIFILLGYQFGREIEDLAVHSGGLGPWIGLMVPVGLAVYILLKYIQRKRFIHQLTMSRITPEEVKQRLDGGEDLLILDLRSRFEFDAEPHTIPGSFQVSIEDLEEHHQKIPRDREIVLFCN